MSALLERAAGAMNWLFPELPWTIRFSYGGGSRAVGHGPERLEIAFKSEAPLRALVRMDLSDFLDYYVAGEADFNGDIYAFVGCRNHVRTEGLWKVALRHQLRYVGLRLFPSGVRRKLMAVSSHYDLPNEFIESYLDTRTRAYSCAIWKDPDHAALPDDESLEEAQYRKHRIAAEALQIQPGDRFIDIGCGYGYMVHMAEAEFGCKQAMGITLSRNQVETGYSRHLKLMHYLDLAPQGQFDKLYTCGMISHLDRSELLRYYRRMFGLLRSGGRAWFHFISPPTNPAGLHNYNTISGTFSQKYVFPDHYQFPIHFHLRALEEIGFHVKDVHFRYGHYAKTLRHWYRRFVENLPRTRPLITPTVERAWHLFLTYASTLDGPKGSILKQVLCVRP